MSDYKLTPRDFGIAGMLARRLGRALLDGIEEGDGEPIHVAVLQVAIGSVLEVTFRELPTDAERLSLLDAFIDTLSVRVNALLAPIDGDDSDSDGGVDVRDVPQAAGILVMDSKDPHCGPHIVLVDDDDEPIAHATLPLKRLPSVIDALRSILFSKTAEGTNGTQTLQ
jgi:hypothetical protein